MELVTQFQRELAQMQIQLQDKTDFDVPLISICYSGDPDFQEIPDSLSKFPLIEQLTVKNSIWAHLPVELSKLTNVKRLKLYLSNSTSLDGLENMTSLISLGLYLPELENLPEQLGNLKNLQFLAIQAKVDSFPESLLELENLKFLYVDGKVKRKSEDSVLSSLSERVSVRIGEFEIDD